MISPGAVAAATGLSGGTSATPGSRSKYFSRLIGSGANRATIRELVVDIDFQTTLDQPIDLSRYLHLLQKYGDKSISILPYKSTDESLTPITRTDDVPRGDDLLPYLAYPPKSMMVAGKSGQRIRLRLSSPYSVYQLKGKADLIKAFNAAGKRVYMKSVTCAATNLLRIGYLHGANPEVFPRDAAMLELGKRGLGTFDAVSAAKGRLGVSKVSYSGFGVSTHAVTVYADESVAADWQDKKSIVHSFALPLIPHSPTAPLVTCCAIRPHVLLLSTDNLILPSTQMTRYSLTYSKKCATRQRQPLRHQSR